MRDKRTPKDVRGEAIIRGKPPQSVPGSQIVGLTRKEGARKYKRVRVTRLSWSLE